MVDVFNPNGYAALGAMMKGQTVIKNATPVGPSANYGISGKVSSALSSIKQAVSDKVDTVVSDIKSSGNGSPVVKKKSVGSSGSYDYSGSGSGAGAATAKELDYYAADLAKRYGMTKETAYSEAMENTSYQRAVKDMQAAGLNPAVLFSAGKVSGAGNGQVFLDRSGYGSGGSGGGSSRRRSGSSSNISGGIYYGVTAAAQVIGTVVGGIRAGYIAGNVAQNVMKSINGFRK